METSRWPAFLILFLPASFTFATAAVPRYNPRGGYRAWIRLGCFPPNACGQVIAAALCPFGRCPHLSYAGASASGGAPFLAENAFKQAGGDG